MKLLEILETLLFTSFECSFNIETQPGPVYNRIHIDKGE